MFPINGSDIYAVRIESDILGTSLHWSYGKRNIFTLFPTQQHTVIGTLVMNNED